MSCLLIKISYSKNPRSLCTQSTLMSENFVRIYFVNRGKFRIFYGFRDFNNFCKCFILKKY